MLCVRAGVFIPLEYVGNVARMELAVEPLLQLLVLVCLGPVPRQRLFDWVKLQVLELAAAQFRIECPPLSIEFDKQGIKRLVNRLTQPRDVQRLEGFGLGLQGYQVIGKTPVLHTVVKINVPRIKAFAQLPIDPKLVPVATQAHWLAILVKAQQEVSQPGGYGALWNVLQWLLGKALLTDKDWFCRIKQFLSKNGVDFIEQFLLEIA